MNTTSLKSFAPKVRLLLQEAITRKLDYVLTADTADLRARAAQVHSLRKQAERDRTGLLERVAYTWFNRFAALRFLDAKGWHPFAARVLTPATPDGQMTGHFYLLYLALVTKMSDCGAYLTGSLIGKHPMIPRISPKKTWEGFAGALAHSTAASLLLVWLLPTQLSLVGGPLRATLLGAFLGLIAVLGDLAESVLKRSTGAKDSGHSLPGIGGALDLIDSLLFTAPLLYLFLRYAPSL